MTIYIKLKIKREIIDNLLVYEKSIFAPPLKIIATIIPTLSAH